MLFLLSFFVMADSRSAEKETNVSKEGNEKPETAKPGEQNKKAKISQDYVLKTIKDLTDVLKNDAKGTEKTYSTRLSIFSLELDHFCKYPDIELETGVYRKWYILVKKAVDEIAKAKSTERIALLIKDTKVSEQAVAAYKKGISDYRTVLKNKPKFEIPDDRMKEMQKKKEEAEREARKRAKK